MDFFELITDNISLFCVMCLQLLIMQIVLSVFLCMQRKAISTLISVKSSDFLLYLSTLEDIMTPLTACLSAQSVGHITSPSVYILMIYLVRHVLLPLFRRIKRSSVKHIAEIMDLIQFLYNVVTLLLYTVSWGIVCLSQHRSLIHSCMVLTKEPPSLDFSSMQMNHHSYAET